MIIDIEQTFKKLEKSKFRSHFFLFPALKQYMKEKGRETIKRHAEDLIQ